ncbi:MAG: flagellar hook-basal body complex protein [Verrucomicrobiota bacterium]
MIGSLVSGVSALKTYTRGLEVVSNNIANVNSIAYKGSRATYGDTFSKLLKDSSPSSDTTSNTAPQQIGNGVQLTSISTNFTQGPVSQTGITTDLAITGNGYFQVLDPTSGTTYATRAGNFKFDDNFNLVTQDGFRVQGLNGGSIRLQATGTTTSDLTYSVITADTVAPAVSGNISGEFSAFSVGTGAFTIDRTGVATGVSNADVEANAPALASVSFGSSGEVTALLTNGATFEIGTIQLTDFVDQQALKKEGSGLYSGFEVAGQINGGASFSPGSNGSGTIRSGALEGGNVDLTEEFTNLIVQQRSFQAGSRIVTTSDQVLQEVVNLKR